MKNKIKKLIYRSWGIFFEIRHIIRNLFKLKRTSDVLTNSLDILNFWIESAKKNNIRTTIEIQNKVKIEVNSKDLKVYLN